MAKKVKAATSETIEPKPASGPSKAMLELMATNTKHKTVRLNKPAMIKPSDIPVGQQISGKVLDVCDSMVTTVKGKLLHLQHENGTEYMFPATGVIRNALAPGIRGDDDKDSKALVAALKEYIGQTLIFRRLDNKTSSKFKKEMFMFDVELVKD